MNNIGLNHSKLKRVWMYFKTLNSFFGCIFFSSTIDYLEYIIFNIIYQSCFLFLSKHGDSYNFSEDILLFWITQNCFFAQISQLSHFSNNKIISRISVTNILNKGKLYTITFSFQNYIMLILSWLCKICDEYIILKSCLYLHLSIKMSYQVYCHKCNNACKIYIILYMEENKHKHI